MNRLRHTIGCALLLLFVSYLSFAQEALMPTLQQFLDVNGKPLSGGKVFTYQAGTTTPLATFTDSTGVTQNTNPIILNSGGFPTNASGNVVGIWLGGQFYKVIVQNSLGVQQYSVDNVSSYNLPFAVGGFSFLEGAPCTGIVGQDVVCGLSAQHRLGVSFNNGVLDFLVSQTSTDTLTNKTLQSPIIHSPTVDSSTNTGNSTFTQVNTVRVFADKQSGADNSAKIQAAISACPGPSCIIDAMALPSEVSGGTVNIDPGGSKIVTILLPSGTTFINQILLRSSLHIYGMGSGGNSQQTLLQSCSTCSTSDMFVIGGSAPVTGIELAHFRIYGTNGFAGNTNQSAISAIAQINGGGLWLSEIHDLNIQGFCGANGTHGIVRLDGSAGGSPPGVIQWDTWRNIQTYRPSGCGPSLELNGLIGQQRFMDSDWESSSGVTTGTNIVITAVSSSLFPFNIYFDNVTNQGADTGVQLAGANAITFNQMHHELQHTAYLVSAGATNTSPVTIMNSQFNGNVGINGGNGSLVNVTAPGSAAAVVLGPGNNWGAVDAVAKTNIGAVTIFGNTGPPLVGSFLWNASSGFPYTVINTGLNPDASGWKASHSVNGCATAASLMAVCDVTVAWTTAMNDALATPICVGQGITSGVPLNGGIVSFNSANAVFRTVAGTAAAAQYTKIHCIAPHD